jgi:hypothetical protein
MIIFKVRFNSGGINNKHGKFQVSKFRANYILTFGKLISELYFSLVEIIIYFSIHAKIGILIQFLFYNIKILFSVTNLNFLLLNQNKQLKTVII